MKNNLKSVPPGGKFESSKREVIVGGDLLDVLVAMPLNQRFIRKDLEFCAQNGEELRNEFNALIDDFLNEAGVKKEQPTIILNLDVPHHLPDLELGVFASLLDFNHSRENTSVNWAISKSDGKNYVLEMILEIE